MFAKENILEDVYYRKIVPNRYIVEVQRRKFCSQLPNDPEADHPTMEPKAGTADDRQHPPGAKRIFLRWASAGRHPFRRRPNR
jgi:hypothetical protein